MVEREINASNFDSDCQHENVNIIYNEMGLYAMLILIEGQKSSYYIRRSYKNFYNAPPLCPGDNMVKVLRSYKKRGLVTETKGDSQGSFFALTEKGVEALNVTGKLMSITAASLPPSDRDRLQVNKFTERAKEITQRLTAWEEQNKTGETDTSGIDN